MGMGGGAFRICECHTPRSCCCSSASSGAARLLLLDAGPWTVCLMHNSAEFWMIILYGTVYFFWPFISSCLRGGARRSVRSPGPFSLFLYSFQLLALEMILTNGDAKIIKWSSSSSPSSIVCAIYWTKNVKPTHSASQVWRIYMPPPPRMASWMDIILWPPHMAGLWLRLFFFWGK